MAEKRRLNLAFSMASPLQREAWKLLRAVPAGQRTDAVCRMILGHRSQGELLSAVRDTIREELKNVCFMPQMEQAKPQEAGNVGDDVLGFLLSLQADDEAVVNGG